MCTEKMRALSYIGADKITFPPKPDGQTDRKPYGRTDIIIYRVASLLNINLFPRTMEKELIYTKKIKKTRISSEANVPNVYIIDANI